MIDSCVPSIIFYRLLKEGGNSHMEGLKIIEKSYNSLLKFKSSITDSSFSTASNLVIMMKNYDMKTQAGIKEAILAVLDVYKDDLGVQNTLKVVSGDKIELKFDKKG